MRKRPDLPAGSLHGLVLDSALLGDNLLGDPTRRETLVYVPAGHDGAGLPLLVDLAGFTGSGLKHAAWQNFGENLPERLDRLIGEGAMPPAVVAMPDCFTRLGGNQYVDSAAMGPWTRYLADELVPAIEARFGCGGSGRRGLFGKSSGGYGALVNAMLRPEVWAAAACLSGDMAFDLCYLPDMPGALRALTRKDGSIERFVTDFEAGPKYPGGDMHALMTLAMAATYDPDPSAFCGIRLPVDPETCELLPERWEAWLAWDPLTLAPSRLGALSGLKLLWLECGRADQYNLLYGARRLHRLLDGRGVRHVYEEFDDSHSSLDYRLDRSLPALARALA
ncbi:alpha/beta hydrolase [Polymorphum gilvum]|uniref:Enterochelin esterase and related enzyme n=1 Tax=Polymorphum gilvum (strain LMG 25793 / CGMCC 1.9160 / SL003B-26A1) TaxID=991905 RepID=F2IZ00_POLGS|nr:alpha/beta hydrolase-fold protein [Polymorphum gilvum]ADZ70615.1 Enterochelin esterase and related enzyme [Polymorphum gilvum SL003B-26A1]